MSSSPSGQVVMARLRMAETLREAATFIEQGHVRVGPTTVTDPAFLVTRCVLLQYGRSESNAYHGCV